MNNIFFDCEFTHIWEAHCEPAELISIGCISEIGETFYGENADFNVALCSYFTIEGVLPLLSGGNTSMPYAMLAKQLRTWIEGLSGEVKMWTDAPNFDWPHVQDLFEDHGWPCNLIRKPALLSFPSSIQHRFEVGVEDAFMTFEPRLRRHHALDDAIANRHGFLIATTE
jgi:hypothetical protein